MEHVKEALHGGGGLPDPLENYEVIITELLHALDKVGVSSHGHQIVIYTLAHAIPGNVGSNLDLVKKEYGALSFLEI